ncbi:MAG: fused DSP-PTPase phosphatase/NAD kinase-like protein [Planctomycetota bacterium]
MARRRRIALLFAALIGVCAAGAGVRYGYWALVEHRFEAITEGQVYKSGEMPAETLLRKVRDTGIRTVVDLRDEDLTAVAEEHAVLEREGIRHVHLPTGQVPSDATVDAFLDLVKRPENRPLLVHCKEGQGRSVLFSAIYRIEFEGWDNERARRATRVFSWRGGFKPGSPKGEYLRAYVPRLHDPD